MDTDSTETWWTTLYPDLHFLSYRATACRHHHKNRAHRNALWRTTCLHSFLIEQYVPASDQMNICDNINPQIQKLSAARCLVQNLPQLLPAQQLPGVQTWPTEHFPFSYHQEGEERRSSLSMTIWLGTDLEESWGGEGKGKRRKIFGPTRIMRKSLNSLWVLSDFTSLFGITEIPEYMQSYF